MGEIAHRRSDGLWWMNAVKVSIGCSRVEVIRYGSPTMVKVEVNRAWGVVGIEHDTGGHDIVGGVKGVKGVKEVKADSFLDLK